MNATAFVYEATTPTGNLLHRQHTELMEALNRFLHLYYFSNSPKESLLEALDHLIELGRRQFGFEEALMQNLAIEQDQVHVKTHEGILRHMRYLRQQIMRAGKAYPLPQFRFLYHWLTNHIAEEMLTTLRQHPWQNSGLVAGLT